MKPMVPWESRKSSFFFFFFFLGGGWIKNMEKYGNMFSVDFQHVAIFFDGLIISMVFKHLRFGLYCLKAVWGQGV